MEAFQGETFNIEAHKYENCKDPSKSAANLLKVSLPPSSLPSVEFVGSSRIYAEDSLVSQCGIWSIVV